jgi:c-di-GMP-binding flagellar brake protein YcgR
LYPTISQMIEIIIENEAGIKSYSSRVADLNEDSFTIQVPFKEGTRSYLQLPVGTGLKIKYTDKSQAQCVFDTTVLNVQKGEFEVATISKPEQESIERTQRRNFLRVPTELEIAIQTTNTKLIARTEDVSGGGVSIYFDEEYRLHTEETCQCWLLIPFRNGTIEHVPFQGRFVRIQKKSGTRFQWSSIKIEKITDSDQQKIMRYCFERQIGLKK